MTYGYAFFETSQTEVDSTFIRLTLTDNKVTLNEVWKKYSDMIDSIRASYKKIDQSVKQLISVQVEMHGQSLTQVVCKVTSIFGIRSVLPDFCTFNDVDWWTWWNWTGQGGICGGPNNNGQGDGLDAAQLINQKIMNCRGIYPGYRYWTDQESVVLEPESYHNLNWGGVDYNYEQYLLYWNHSDYSNFHGCLSPDECNFYLEGTKWVANTAHSQGGARPDNKSFISIAIYGDAVWDQPNLGDSKYLHHGPVYYGIWHYYTSPATALD
jgi:hypothetical protein